MSLSVNSWEVPFTLNTPAISLDFNADISLSSGATGQFHLNPANCEALIPIRVQDDDIPQGDGEITHERFYQGYLMTLAVQMWTDDSPACNADLTEMADMLMLAVRSIPSATNDLVEARVLWTPTNAAERMIRRVILNEALTWGLDGGVVQAQFQVKSMYPYAWDSTELTSALPDVLTNTGTADMWPVIQVYASTAFTITNANALDANGVPLSIYYTDANPGADPITGSDYVEIDTFRNTMYLNGNGANMKPGLVVATSDFFPLVIGTNVITITGAAADVLWQNAWG